MTPEHDESTLKTNLSAANVFIYTDELIVETFVNVVRSITYLTL
jgi:hypothetical protein